MVHRFTRSDYGAWCHQRSLWCTISPGDDTMVHGATISPVQTMTHLFLLFFTGLSGVRRFTWRTRSKNICKESGYLALINIYSGKEWRLKSGAKNKSLNISRKCRNRNKTTAWCKGVIKSKKRHHCKYSVLSCYYKTERKDEPFNIICNKSSILWSSRSGRSCAPSPEGRACWFGGQDHRRSRQEEEKMVKK